MIPRTRRDLLSDGVGGSKGISAPGDGDCPYTPVDAHVPYTRCQPSRR